MRHIGGGEQRKMSFLKQIMCRGTGCQGSGDSRRVSALFPAGHDGGRSWSAEGGLPRQTGECSASPPSGSAPAWGGSWAGSGASQGSGRASLRGAGRRGSCPLLPGMELPQVWAGASQGSCMNCSRPLPPRKLPCAGISAAEGESAIRIDSSGVGKPGRCMSRTPLQGAHPRQQGGHRGRVERREEFWVA